MTAPSWNLKALVLWHLALAALVGSFFWVPTKGYWEVVDTVFFKFINGSLVGNPTWQMFWACANHRYADWLEDLCILAFFAFHLRRMHKNLRLKGASDLLFCVLYIAAIIYFVNRLFFRVYLEIPRDSPTRVITDSFMLSEHIDWMNIKDGSSKSFPGDHATTAVLFAAMYTFFAGKRLGILACIYALFLCLPRLITGAHWLSDIVVGSGAIAIFFLSWALCSPCAFVCSKNIEKVLRFFAFLFTMPFKGKPTQRQEP